MVIGDWGGCFGASPLAMTKGIKLAMAGFFFVTLNEVKGLRDSSPLAQNDKKGRAQNDRK